MKCNRITEADSILLAEALSSRDILEQYMSHNYPPGELGMLLLRTDLYRFGMTKQIDMLDEIEQPDTPYEIVIMGDAKGKNHKFGLTTITGEPIYCGHFLEDKVQNPKDTNGQDAQLWSEFHALLNAIRLCQMYCYYRGIKPQDLTLCYLTDAQNIINQMRSQTCMTYYAHKTRQLLKETGISLQVEWIRGVDNHADRYTLVDGEVVHPNFKVMDKILYNNVVAKALKEI